MRGMDGDRPWMDVDDTATRELEVDASAASRRDFLKLFGLGAAASLAACGRVPVKEAIPLLIHAEDVTPGVVAHYASTCLACPASCGLVATVRDGRPVKLEGDPRHALSRGGLCALGQGELRGLYEPSRLRAPTIGGREVSWTELDKNVGERLRAIVASGRGVVVLAPTLVSPTARAAVMGFIERMGGELIEHDGGVVAVPAVGLAYGELDGTPLRPSYDLSAVDLWVSLATDLLGAGPEPVTHTASWAERRRRASERGLMRHVQVESSLSLTGANADERWLHTASERRGLAVGLLAAVSAQLAGAEARAIRSALGDPPLVGDPERLTGLARELVAAGSRGLVTSGSSDVGEQLAVAVTNRLLGAEGTTLSLASPSLTVRGAGDGVARLRDRIASGRVGALITVDCDPLDEIADEELTTQLAGLDLTVAIATQPSATSRAADVVVAAHHSLECWADAEPRPGMRTLAQPSIRPLFATRHPFLSFLRWSGETVDDWRHYLETSWRKNARAAAVLTTPGGWPQLWAHTVRAAGLDEAVAWFDFATPTEASTRALDGEAIGRRLKAGDAAVDEGDQVELIEEVAVRDGSGAHIPWLRELPDPLTRASWTACARIAPERARALGVTDGDVVAVTTAAGAVRLPARIQPGQHPRVIAVPVGYGRAAGDPADWNANRLRAPGAATAGLSATIERTGERTLLPLIQLEADTHGRPIVHQLEALGDHPHQPHVPDGDLWSKQAVSSPHWEMVVDLDACTGCSACVVACQAENNIAVVGPEQMARHRDMHWLRMDRYYVGDAADPDVLFEPMLCAQCDDAPCETVCPVAATVHSEDGLNQQVYNRCVGTRYCANNCPYKVRRFNWFENSPTEPIERMVLNPDVVVRSRGVMEKCTFCVQRIQANRIAARRDGEESFEVETACQQSCPARAIHFGDGTAESGPLAALKSQANAFQVLAELGIRPSITYLARHRNRGGGAHGEDAHDHPASAVGHGEDA